MKRFTQLFAIDLRTLALVRVCLGLLIIADLVIRSRDFSAHYTDGGVVPRHALGVVLDYVPASLHMISGSPWITAMVFLLAGFTALLLTIGYRSQLVAFVSWLLLLSLDSRNQFVGQGGDMLLRVLLFWAMFLPIGARFSVDAALDRTPRGNSYVSVASAGLLIQVMCVYFFTALLKSDPVWIPDGTAVYYALANDTFVTPIGEWLRQFPVLMSALTYFVWVLEIVAPLLVFCPIFNLQVRLFGLTLLILMHVGFLACLHIGLFPLISITSLLTFTPGWIWEVLSKRVRTPARAGIHIYYDQDCGFCEKTCHILRTLLVLPDARIAPAQSDPEVAAVLAEHNSWVVRDHEGNQYLRGRALAWLIGQSPLFGPIGALLELRPFRRPLEAFYGWVADHRARFSRISGLLMPWREIRMESTVVGSAVCALFLTVVLWNNLGSLTIVEVGVPRLVQEVSASLRLGQSWSMFAPAPSHTSGWFVAVGELADGRQVDVYRGVEEPPTWDRDTYLSLNYRTYRWRKYLARLPTEDRVEIRPYYVQYLCQRWQQQHGDAPLTALRLYFVAEYTQPPTLPKEIERLLTWQSRCDADPDLQVAELRKGVLPDLT